jgi:hypothetical protein
VNAGEAGNCLRKNAGSARGTPPHRGSAKFLAHHGAGVQVFVKHTLLQPVHVDVATLVAGEGLFLLRILQGLEAQFEAVLT